MEAALKIIAGMGGSQKYLHYGVGFENILEHGAGALKKLASSDKIPPPPLAVINDRSLTWKNMLKPKGHLLRQFRLYTNWRYRNQ